MIKTINALDIRTVLYYTDYAHVVEPTSAGNHEHIDHETKLGEGQKNYCSEYRNIYYFNQKHFFKTETYCKRQLNIFIL